MDSTFILSIKFRGITQSHALATIVVRHALDCRAARAHTQKDHGCRHRFRHRTSCVQLRPHCKFKTRPPQNRVRLLHTSAHGAGSSRQASTSQACSSVVIIRIDDSGPTPRAPAPVRYQASAVRTHPVRPTTQPLHARGQPFPTSSPLCSPPSVLTSSHSYSAVSAPRVPPDNRQGAHHPSMP